MGPGRRPLAARPIATGDEGQVAAADAPPGSRSPDRTYIPAVDQPGPEIVAEHNEAPGSEPIEAKRSNGAGAAEPSLEPGSLDTEPMEPPPDHPQPTAARRRTGTAGVRAARPLAGRGLVGACDRLLPAQPAAALRRGAELGGPAPPRPSGAARPAGRTAPRPRSALASAPRPLWSRPDPGGARADVVATGPGLPLRASSQLRGVRPARTDRGHPHPRRRGPRPRADRSGRSDQRSRPEPRVGPQPGANRELPLRGRTREPAVTATLLPPAPLATRHAELIRGLVLARIRQRLEESGALLDEQSWLASEAPGSEAQWSEQLDELERLAPRTPLGRLDRDDALLVTAAGLIEDDIRFGALFAALQAPLTSRRPCVGLLSWLLAGSGDDHELAWRCQRLARRGILEVSNTADPRAEWVVKLPVAVGELVQTRHGLAGLAAWRPSAPSRRQLPAAGSDLGVSRALGPDPGAARDLARRRGECRHRARATPVGAAYAAGRGRPRDRLGPGVLRGGNGERLGQVDARGAGGSRSGAAGDALPARLRRDPHRASAAGSRSGDRHHGGPGRRPDRRTPGPPADPDPAPLPGAGPPRPVGTLRPRPGPGRPAGHRRLVPDHPGQHRRRREGGADRNGRDRPGRGPRRRRADRGGPAEPPAARAPGHPAGPAYLTATGAGSRRRRGAGDVCCCAAATGNGSPPRG